MTRLAGVGEEIVGRFADAFENGDVDGVGSLLVETEAGR
jgi:hypothetical protein